MIDASAMYSIFMPCPACKAMPRLVPTFASFTLQCDCPPPQIVTSDSAAPIGASTGAKSEEPK